MKKFYEGRLYEAKIDLEMTLALLDDPQLIKEIYDDVPLDEAIKDLERTVVELEDDIKYYKKEVDKNE